MNNERSLEVDKVLVHGYVNRWLLKINKYGTVDIINRTASVHAPLNRILDEVGHYELEFFDIEGIQYFCTFKPGESKTNKSMIHVGKRVPGNGRMQSLADMGDEDLVNFPKIRDYFFNNQNIKKH